MKLRRYITFMVLAACALPLASEGNHSNVRLSTVAEMREDIGSVPCVDRERIIAVRTLFEKMGAPPDAIAIEKRRGVENLVIRKEGSGDGRIVIGAHYDKTGAGSCGAVDNWTGIVTLAHIYKAIRDVSFTKTIVFVAFGDEERGMVGSKAMLSEISKEEARRYCAMINIDSLGMASTQAMTGISSRSLEKLAGELAANMKISFKTITVRNASSDSASFLAKKIPAVTISGLPDNWMSVFHSKYDQVERINPDNVYDGYRLTLAMVLKVDEGGCDLYR